MVFFVIGGSGIVISMLPPLNVLVSVINFYPPDILMFRIWRTVLEIKSAFNCRLIFEW